MKQEIVLAIFSLIVSAYCMDSYPAEYFAYQNMSSNWTTCQKFLANTTFNSSAVMDVDWQIFYFWNVEYENNYNVRFSTPTAMLIERFIVMVDNDLKSQLNWSASELFVETSIDLSGIFIAQNTSGLFRFIPAVLSQYHSLPKILFGLKLVDGYLGMMNCDIQVAYALAPVQNIPKAEQIEAAAAKLNFWNPWGRSYLVTQNNTGVIATQEADLDDAEDEVERAIERDRNSFQMF